eukprot:PhM_4_TR18814/c2_g1_i4/m.35863/K14379/ACP5; tartrate-resistant acid phosphatase type 5
MQHPELLFFIFATAALWSAADATATTTRTPFDINQGSLVELSHLHINASSYFLSIGDWGGVNRHASKIARGMARVASNRRTAFVVSTGDHFYHHGVTSPTDERFYSTFQRQFAQEIDKSAAEGEHLTWYLVLGNHDYNYSPTERSLGYSIVPEMRRAMAQVAYSKFNPNWRMPARYFTQTVSFPPAAAGKRVTIRFIYIDTVTLHKCFPEVRVGCDATQRDWLANIALAPKPHQEYDFTF